MNGKINWTQENKTLENEKKNQLQRQVFSVISSRSGVGSQLIAVAFSRQNPAGKCESFTRMLPLFLFSSLTLIQEYLAYITLPLLEKLFNNVPDLGSLFFSQANILDHEQMPQFASWKICQGKQEGVEILIWLYLQLYLP